jgi:hypothetical protein
MKRIGLKHSRFVGVAFWGMKIREDETIDMSFESFVARRYLRIKHERRMVPIITILATLGVSVGVMVLVVVIAVMSGFQSAL